MPTTIWSLVVGEGEGAWIMFLKLWSFCSCLGGVCALISVTEVIPSLQFTTATQFEEVVDTEKAVEGMDQLK